MNGIAHKGDEEYENCAYERISPENDETCSYYRSIGVCLGKHLCTFKELKPEMPNPPKVEGLWIMEAEVFEAVSYLKRKKAELEDVIERCIEEFEEKSGLAVTFISLKRTFLAGGAVPLSFVKADVKLYGEKNDI